MENLLIILRCIAAGDKTILENIDGTYSSIRIKSTSLVQEGAEERDIESRLQFELYGEYPLSDSNQHDWDRNIKYSFNLK